MIRTGFDFKVVANTYAEAHEIAKNYMGEFLDIKPGDVEEVVDIEFRVSLPKADSLAEITETMDNKMLVVTIFGSVKRSVSKAFGQQ